MKTETLPLLQSCVVCGKDETDPRKLGAKVMPDGSEAPCHTGCLFVSLYEEEDARRAVWARTRFAGVRFYGRIVGRRAT